MNYLKSFSENKLKSLYDEVKSLVYILEDENLKVYVNIIDVRIEVLLHPNGYKIIEDGTDGRVTGEKLQNRMDSIKEFYDRCMELCEEYNFRLSTKDLGKGSKLVLMIISPMSDITFADVFESRIIGYNKYLEELCGIDIEEIENIFQDVLDEFPLMDVKIDSIPVFNDNKYPFMITLLIDSNFHIKTERENGERISDVRAILDIILYEHLDQINGRLSDVGLKVRDARVVHIGGRYIKKYHDDQIVIRIYSI